MITIAMKSNGPLDQNSLLSKNQPRIQGSFTARDITTLNRPVMQRYPQAHTSSTSMPTQTHANAHSASQPTDNCHTHTQAHTSWQPSSQPAASHHTRTQAHTNSQPSSQPTAIRHTQAAVPSAAPQPRQKLPPLTKPVQKGQKAPLAPGNMVPGILTACFGWNTSNPQCDADVSAFLLGADGKVIGDSWFVFYGQAASPDRSCRLEPGHNADREAITIDFRKLNAKVKKIVFVLTIHEAFAKRLHFGMMQDAYIRILDEHGREAVSFQMAEYYSNVISMMIGEIYQHNGSWKFNAIGNGVAKDLAGLCALYGVEVSD